MFTKAIVKTPCRNLIKGLSMSNLGKPDYSTALKQHGRYIEAIIKCGLKVTELEADEQYPDSVFIEDTALVSSDWAVITNPGAFSRKGEVKAIKKILTEKFRIIEEIRHPGTLDAGDVMKVDNHYFIGRSERTNSLGAQQLFQILSKFGYTSTILTVENSLHLKSDVSYLQQNNLLSTIQFYNKSEFEKYNRIPVEPAESYAANSLWLNDRVLVPKGFPDTRSKIEKLGYETIELDVSEFRKLDGGLSCLSLRY